MFPLNSYGSSYGNSYGNFDNSQIGRPPGPPPGPPPGSDQCDSAQGPPPPPPPRNQQNANPIESLLSQFTSGSYNGQSSNLLSGFLNFQ